MTTQMQKWFANEANLTHEQLPQGFTPEQAKRVALQVLSDDERSGGKLAKCQPRTLWLALMKSIALGLDVSLQEAYLVPYGQSCELMISYRGLIKLAKKSGQVTHVVADVVREGDQIFYARGTDGSGLTHKPLPFNEGSIVGAYALFTMRDGSVDFEAISRADIDMIRSKAAKGSGAWNDFFGEMAKKSVIRRGLKRMELNPDDMRAIVADDDHLYAHVRQQQPHQSESSLNRVIAARTEPQLGASEPDEEDLADIQQAHNDGNTKKVEALFKGLSEHGQAAFTAWAGGEA